MLLAEKAATGQKLDEGTSNLAPCNLEQIYASLAQSGERNTVTVEVRGSKPLRGAILWIVGRVVKAAVC